MDTRDNKVLDGRILLRQPVHGFRSGSDAVLLAAAAHPPRHGHVIDLGCGTGSVMLCIACRRPDVRITGVEIDAPTAGLASLNLRRNGLARQGNVVVADISSIALTENAFDMVVANPPYFREWQHRLSPDPNRNRARAETAATLEDWTAAAVRLLAPDGEAVFIMRSERVSEVRDVLPQGWNATVMPVYGNPDRPPKRSLIRFARRSLPSAAPPVFLHRMGGAESSLATAIFRHGAPLFWP